MYPLIMEADIKHLRLHTGYQEGCASCQVTTCRLPPGWTQRFSSLYRRLSFPYASDNNVKKHHCSRCEPVQTIFWMLKDEAQLRTDRSVKHCSDSCWSLNLSTAESTLTKKQDSTPLKITSLDVTVAMRFFFWLFFLPQGIIMKPNPVTPVGKSLHRRKSSNFCALFEGCSSSAFYIIILFGSQKIMTYTSFIYRKTTDNEDFIEIVLNVCLLLVSVIQIKHKHIIQRLYIHSI